MIVTYPSILLRICILLSLLVAWSNTFAQLDVKHFDTLVLRSVTESDSANAEWRHILATRNNHSVDSTTQLLTTFTIGERNWFALIASRQVAWELMLDSLARPFEANLPSKVTIIVGSHGVDDAFTFDGSTIGFDASILEKNYGNANSAENTERIDRLFAHEMTHLFHKAWVKSEHMELRTFKDSVLWECIYEGLGTYRSLSSKWLPQEDSLPAVTEVVLDALLPEFLANIEKVCNAGNLTVTQKADITRNLSRGTISKKWGAFTVAIWIARFVGEDEGKLKLVVESGINSPILLAIRNIPFNSPYKPLLMECLAR
ncbi:hypothetical protein [Dyadobacter soli]|nr:hypothetical protein [Dyadobacter soli]